jgi:GNAT superfamily N-acetyltransferase
MNIRTATNEDKEDILSLVKKLAEYERIKPEEVQLTIDKIESHGFGRYFDILIAEHNKKSVGYALYFFSYSASAGEPILYLEDLFVEYEYRLQGFGKALLSRLANLAIENECCRMEWHAFIWNEKAIQFYNNLGATPKPDLLQFRLFGEHLSKLSAEK